MTYNGENTKRDNIYHTAPDNTSDIKENEDETTIQQEREDTADQRKDKGWAWVICGGKYCLNSSFSS